MGRNSGSPDHVSSGDDIADSNSGTGSGSLALHSVRDRFRFKRNPNLPTTSTPSKTTSNSSDRQWRGGRSHFRPRKFLMFPFRTTWSALYFCIFSVMFLFALASMVLQNSIASLMFGQGSERLKKSVQEELKFGSSLTFVPWKMQREFELRGGLDRLQSEARIGLRSPRLGLILGNTRKGPPSLMLSTVMKNLQMLGYILQIYALEDGEAISSWEKIGGHVSILSPEIYGHTDWTIFEGIVVDSLDAKDVILSFMQEPFCSVPLIWIIREDILAKRLPLYVEMGWETLIAYWKNAFRRPDVVVFPDFSLPMLYNVIDNGNFFVIPGTPVDVWTAERYRKVHARSQLRLENGYSEDDMIVLVVGSSFFYSELSWDYAVAMHSIGPLLTFLARGKDPGGVIKFVFACGNSSDKYNDALQEIIAHLGLNRDSVHHHGLDGDVDGLLFMADIVLYGSSQEEQGFPSLLARAMSFGIPVVAPDYPIIKKYVVDGVHGILFSKQNPDELTTSFLRLISNDGKLSEFARNIALSGRLLAKNMLASECIIGYAKLLENILPFPSDSMLPEPFSQLKQVEWLWELFQGEIDQREQNEALINSSVVTDVEEELKPLLRLSNVTRNESEVLFDDIPTAFDWSILLEMENSAEVERLEEEQIEERTDKNYGIWDEVYRNARKAETFRFETYEKDEGELERTGQPVCIYEVYNGAGAWHFLHHGSLYRGLSLSSKSRRLRSDDVDAVGRLQILNDSYYRDILCEIGGMFSIANRVDNIHKRPWIGFQSWRAAGRKVSLSDTAEQVLEQTIQGNTKGDVIYFWSRLDKDDGFAGSNNVLTFWSMCDILNGGNCRTIFEDAFRNMYGLPSDAEALPPMPEDGGHWSALHSWVMPTPSFLEFVRFSRIFADSINNLHINSSKPTECLLGSSRLEKKHCYCRILELLVNVWAYHSAQKMVYIDPESGLLQEQHPVEQRREFMWAKYFNLVLLKSMDEDLAEAADDGDLLTKNWLWPLTGEVYWRGIFEREREERYRVKMDKKRKHNEKLADRQKHGYKQKALGE